MTKEIRLTQEKVALVDDEDFERLNQYKWYAMRGDATYYASRKAGTWRAQQTILMHNDVLPTEEGCTPDHVDGNGLNNQKHNLRPATRHQQAGNVNKKRGSRSRYKGVSVSASRINPWAAFISVDGVNTYLGIFPTEEQAAREYDASARNIFGEFAKCNFKENE